MRVFHTTAHRAHDPRSWLFKGGFTQPQEVPQRADVLLAAAREAGHPIVEVAGSERDAIRAVHDDGYLHYLEHAWRMWRELPGASAEVVPNVHPGRRMHARPESVVGLAGYYQADGACPIGEGTWAGALASAQVAVHAARDVMNGHARAAYALCRPPGHHAYADLAGGFCFLNNTAIAAEQCRALGAAKVAIVDVDVHHGNGTQGIFYHRPDVLTVSLHGDPARFYPYFAGYAEELGEGPGRGANLNLPLPQGSGDAAYLPRLEDALERVAAFAPDVLVVALGLDASVDDPLAFLALTGDGFRRIGAALAAVGMPSVIVQEGGYLSPRLGANLQAALSGFEEER
jgi:acetoin utilization deacetylase AcuC-like enzyme